jgi:cephalosporin hydroxylase
MSNLDPAKQYHEWYYNNEIWKQTTFLGVDCLKSVSDMWNYQEIIWKLKPSLVVEFGAYHGGATMFFSMLLKAVNPRSKVLCVDLNFHQYDTSLLKKERHIEMMHCSSTDPKVKERIIRLRKKFKGPVFFILDSDHSKAHVLAELGSLRDVTRPGDYLVVEDSNINGHPVLPDFGEGPMEAINEYFAKYPDDYLHDIERENKFGFTFAPNGFLIRR